MGALRDKSSLADLWDRWLFLRSFPLLYPTLSFLALWPMARFGNISVISDPTFIREILTNAPLDRGGKGTTGGLVFDTLGVEALFTGSGATHRTQRSLLISNLARGEVLSRYRTELSLLVAQVDSATSPVDAVPYLRAAAGAMTAELLGLNLPALELMNLIDDVADTGAKIQLRKKGNLEKPALALAAKIANTQTERGLTADLISEFGEKDGIAVSTIAAVAASVTAVATSTRALAWISDAKMWGSVLDEEFLNLLIGKLSPSPLMPRTLAKPWNLAGHYFDQGDRLILNNRHASQKEMVLQNSSKTRSNLAFGAGAHRCPGASAALRQLLVLAETLAPLSPKVHKRQVGVGRALPRWDCLLLSRADL